MTSASTARCWICSRLKWLSRSCWDIVLSTQSTRKSTSPRLTQGIAAPGVQFWLLRTTCDMGAVSQHWYQHWYTLCTLYRFVVKCGLGVSLGLVLAVGGYTHLLMRATVEHCLRRALSPKKNFYLVLSVKHVFLIFLKWFTHRTCMNLMFYYGITYIRIHSMKNIIFV